VNLENNDDRKMSSRKRLETTLDQTTLPVFAGSDSPSLTGLLEPRPEDVLSMDSKSYFDSIIKSNLSIPASYSSVALGKYFIQYTK
jgi:hypothetical protein